MSAAHTHSWTPWRAHGVGYVARRCSSCGRFQRRQVERPESIAGTLREIRLQRWREKGMM